MVVTRAARRRLRFNPSTRRSATTSCSPRTPPTRTASPRPQLGLRRRQRTSAAAQPDARVHDAGHEDRAPDGERRPRGASDDRRPGRRARPVRRHGILQLHARFAFSPRGPRSATRSTFASSAVDPDGHSRSQTGTWTPTGSSTTPPGRPSGVRHRGLRVALRCTRRTATRGRRGHGARRHVERRRSRRPTRRPARRPAKPSLRRRSRWCASGPGPTATDPGQDAERARAARSARRGPLHAARAAPRSTRRKRVKGGAAALQDITSASCARASRLEIFVPQAERDRRSTPATRSAPASAAARPTAACAGQEEAAPLPAAPAGSYLHSPRK